MRALIIVDLQNDFLPGGSLAVPHGDEVISVINDLQKECDIIIASKDWHPKGHISFNHWPPHCIQNTKGAEFPKTLNKERIEKVFFKAEEIDRDSYSAFEQMEIYLRERGATELWIVGLALDYCVRKTALDAFKRGWKVAVILKGCRGLDKTEEVIKELDEKGLLIDR